MKTKQFKVVDEVVTNSDWGTMSLSMSLVALRDLEKETKCNYFEEAFDLLSEVMELPQDWTDTEFWTDLMVDTDDGKIYAVFSDGAITSSGEVIYIEVEKEKDANISTHPGGE